MKFLFIIHHVINIPVSILQSFNPCNLFQETNNPINLLIKQIMVRTISFNQENLIILTIKVYTFNILTLNRP